MSQKITELPRVESKFFGAPLGILLGTVYSWFLILLLSSSIRDMVTFYHAFIHQDPSVLTKIAITASISLGVGYLIALRTSTSYGEKPDYRIGKLSCIRGFLLGFLVGGIHTFLAVSMGVFRH